MIISIAKLRELVPSATAIDDETLQAQLEGLESLIRAYTNNNFQSRNKRIETDVINGKIEVSDVPFIKSGDTVQISRSLYNDGVYTLGSEDDLVDERDVIVTVVEYPPDVIMGAVNMFKWDMENRNKVGIQSETISRHSVTYFNMDGDNSLMGYPKSLTGFLLPYMKARF